MNDFPLGGSLRLRIFPRSNMALYRPVSSCTWFKIGAGVVGGIFVLRCIMRLHKRCRKGKKPRPQGIVIVHEFRRGTKTPNLSPYPIKVETFLRMTNIPYEPCFETPMSVKGKSPWISYNDDDIADSSFCLEYLKEKFNVDVDSHLSEEQKATAYAFKVMVEEYLYWCLVLYRWVYETPPSVPVPSRAIFPTPLGLPFSWFKAVIRRSLMKAAYYQGIGRHSPEEVAQITEKILRSLSKYLGDKLFFMGDTPSEVDCSIFGFLVQAVWNLPDTPLEALVNGELRNLRQYTFRMKEKFWPDWEDCLHTTNA